MTIDTVSYTWTAPVDPMIFQEPAPPGMNQVPAFRASIDSFDWIRVGWLVLGVVIGLKILRKG